MESVSLMMVFTRIVAWYAATKGGTYHAAPENTRKTITDPKRSVVMYARPGEPNSLSMRLHSTRKRSRGGGSGLRQTI